MNLKRPALLACLGLALATVSLSAQGPGAPPPGGPPHGPGEGGPAMNAAGFFLAHTGQLKLNDQQVTRLAAISRRTAERHEAMMSAMRAQPPRAGADRQPPGDAERERMRQRMEQAHQQMQADLRDALTVLTPDQQAQAWMLAAMAHGAGPGGDRGHGRGGPGHGEG
ncbi:MAG TPA: Spy/CpxP family protein refolding chaperone, partial [Longimicrobium sp.]|nr:Spy/CpxP family protein refolding chaperone [Longimicrobium sp.]